MRLVMLVGAVLLAVVWVAAFTIIRLDRQAAIEAAIRENENRAIAFKEYVTRTFDAGDVAARIIAEDAAAFLARGEAGGATPFPRLRIHTPLFDSVMIADADGKIRNARPGSATRINVGDQAGFEAVRRQSGDRPLITAPTRSAGDPAAYVSIVRPIRSATGRFLGAVFLRISAERLVRFNEGARLLPLDLVSVIRLDGVTLARRTGDRISYGENVSGKLVMWEQYRRPNGTYLGPSALDGKLRFFSHRRLDHYPVFATVGLGEADVLAAPALRARWFLSGAAALTISLCVAAWLITLYSRRREEAAQEICAAHDRMERAQRVGGVGDWTFDPASNRLTCAAVLNEMYGRPPVRMDMSLDEYVAAFDLPSRVPLRHALEVALETGKPQTVDCFTRMGRGSGSARRLTIEPAVAEDGRVVALTGIDQDVTLQKAHERLVARLVASGAPTCGHAPPAAKAASDTRR